MTTIEQRLAAAKKEIEECERLLKSKELPDILWKPDFGEKYWYLTAAFYTAWDSDGLRAVEDCQEVYRTSEEAKRANEVRKIKMRVLRRIAELNHEAGWVCDFSNPHQQKCYLRYEENKKLDLERSITTGWVYTIQVKPASNYFCQEVYDGLLKDFSKEELIAFITEE